MSDNERDPVQDPIEDEEEVSFACNRIPTMLGFLTISLFFYQLDFSSLKKKKKSKKKVEFEDVDQPSETATPENEPADGECCQDYCWTSYV